MLILTEMGLDPGLDHLSAASLINKLVSNKKRLVSFTSMCGGLPAPDCAYDVPLKYKFSWRPQGVLLAALQDAFYVLFGEVGGLLLGLINPNVVKRSRKSVVMNCLRIVGRNYLFLLSLSLKVYPIGMLSRI